METFVTLAIPALLTLGLIRTLLLPIKTVCKTAIYGLCGFLCLWMLNGVSCFTGIQFPLNAITVLIAGFGGVPAIGLLALLAVI